MEIHALLFLAAVVAGTVNAMAGGGGLLTFPVLTTVITPVTADATSAVALFPCYLTSTWAGRKQLAPMRRWFLLLLGPSLLGGLLGALLLTWSSNKSFMALIPWLVLVATLLTLRPLMTRGGKRQQSFQASHSAVLPLPSLVLQVAAGLLLFLVAIYGGYFGAGIGILIIGAFDLIGVTDIKATLPLKNALSGCLRGVAVIVFIIEGKVNWQYGPAMAAGALLGGYLGGSLAHWTNRTMVRIGVVALGFGMTAFYFWKIYGSSLPFIGSD